jgi:hypothetical protein
VHDPVRLALGASPLLASRKREHGSAAEQRCARLNG